MTLRLEALATCGAALSALVKDYPDMAELKIGLGLVIEELRKEIRSVEKKQRAAA